MLYVIAPVFNPIKYKSRIRLYSDFEKYIKCSGATLYTIEAAYRDGPFEVTQPDNPNHIQVRIKHILWHKERMINLAINRLPLGWSKVAWIDPDIIFTRPDWVEETLNQLDIHPVIQMFTRAHDLSPQNCIYKSHTGLIYAYKNDLLTGSSKNYSEWHPGFAWAARKDALDDLGCLFDRAILGAGDRHFSCAMLGFVEKSYQEGLSKEYKELLNVYQNNALKYVKNNVGYLDTDLLHYWHGKKADRKYKDRWQILIKHQYDPNLDIKTDTSGMYQFNGDKEELRRDIIHYFKGRSEDSIDM